MNEAAAVRQMPKIKACAEKAGIGHALFPGYGTLLGLVRNRALIPYDSDTDFCIRSDLISPAQEYEFYKALDEAGMFEARRRRRTRDDNGRILWLSLKSEHGGCKSCIWFQFPWNGFVWHSKGKRWVNKIGRRKQLDIDFDKAQAIAKGIPQECLICEMIEKEFYGEKYHVPINYGTALDYWYNGWQVPREGGSSTADYYLVVYDWAKEREWQMIKV